MFLCVRVRVCVAGKDRKMKAAVCSEEEFQHTSHLYHLLGVCVCWEEKWHIISILLLLARVCVGGGVRFLGRVREREGTKD